MAETMMLEGLEIPATVAGVEARMVAAGAKDTAQEAGAVLAPVVMADVDLPEAGLTQVVAAEGVKTNAGTVGESVQRNVLPSPRL